MNRSSGRRDRWNRDVQRAGHSGEDLLYGIAAHWDRGAESDIRTLRRMSKEISAQIKALKKMGLFPLML